MNWKSWHWIVAILAGIVSVPGCQPSGGSNPAAVSYRDFKIEIPATFDGAFNPDGATVGPEVGSLAPEISAADLDGVSFKLSDYRGKVVMLDFWGDW